jgi:hypothetical protein
MAVPKPPEGLSDEPTTKDADAKQPAPAPKPKKPTPAAAKKAVPVKKTATHFRAVAAPIHHPYQKVTVPVSGSVLLEPDSWVEVQLAAKVIEAVKG